MTEPGRKPVSWFTVAVVFVGLGLFGLVVRWFYTPPGTLRSYNVAGEELPDDQMWKATPEGRKEHLAELKGSQSEMAGSYGWIDRENGVVRLPLDRAMEITAEELKASQGR